jgi:hypothetical protein
MLRSPKGVKFIPLSFIARGSLKEQAWMRYINHAIDYGVIGLLLALSLWSVAIAIERWLFYR